MGRRVLVTGLDTFWGGKVAAALEKHPEIEMVLGMGTGRPSVELERTEYVRADQSYSLLERIVRATEVDTVVHTFLVVDSTKMSGRALHEINVIGTMNLLAAAGAPGSSVRQVVVKSSTVIYGAGPKDPTWFDEDTPRTRTSKTRLERSLTEVETYVHDFAEDNPDILVTVLRFANVLGTSIKTPISRNLTRGMFPSVAGFDPQVQFVEEDDVIRCLELVVRERIRGCLQRRRRRPTALERGRPDRRRMAPSLASAVHPRGRCTTRPAEPARAPAGAGGPASLRTRCGHVPPESVWASRFDATSAGHRRARSRVAYACSGLSAITCPATPTTPRWRPSSSTPRPSCADLI